METTSDTVDVPADVSATCFSAVDDEDDVLVPHKGHVFLEKRPTVVEVVDALVMHRKPLPFARWQLVFDDNGYAAVEDLDEMCDAICLEDHLDKLVYRTSKGELVVMSRVLGVFADWS